MAPKADEIVDMVQSDIVSGRLPPGSVLRQEQLARSFRVSRTPVREALKRLHAAGLVSLIPHRGARVRSLSVEDMRETFVIRAELEALAAELAAMHADARQLGRLAAADARFSRLSEALDRSGARDGDLIAEWVGANHDFHDIVLESSRVRLLMELGKSVRIPLPAQMLADGTGELSDLFATGVRQHRAIRELITARSPAGARAVMREHVEWSGAVTELASRRAENASAGTDRLRRIDPFYLRGGESA
jgi:DNA-binding GntR family transcriptional regulator